MIKGKTKSGFQYEVSERIIKDKRFFDLMKEFQKKDGARDGLAVMDTFDKLLVVVLGEEQRDRLFDHIIEHDAEKILDIDVLTGSMLEIIQRLQENKTAKK